MLDDLLGRTELKERIEELEEEKRHLERQLEAEQERRSEAASARQDAEERVNRLEDRIADLEGRLDERTDEGVDVGFRYREEVRGERLDDVLARLAGVETGPEGALTAMVTDGDDLPGPVRETLGARAGLASRAAPCLVYADDAGLVAVALAPPVAPGAFVEWADGFRVDRSWFRPTGRHALALVRADLFAVGTYADGDRVAYDGFESDVKGKHSKGGFSQARFERVREGQIDDHLDRCADALADVDADRTFLVGDRLLVDVLRDDHGVAADATAAVDATGDPEEALADARRTFWTTRLYGL